MNIRKAIDSNGSEYKIVTTRPRVVLRDDSPAGIARAKAIAGTVGEERVPQQSAHITPQGEIIQRAEYYKRRAAYARNVTPFQRKRRIEAQRKKDRINYGLRIQNKARTYAERVKAGLPASKSKHPVIHTIRGDFVLASRLTTPSATHNRPPKPNKTPSGSPAPAAQMRKRPVAQQNPNPGPNPNPNPGPNPNPNKKFKWGDALKNSRAGKTALAFDRWLQDQSGDYRPRPPKPLDQTALDLLSPKKQQAARDAFQQRERQYLKDEGRYNTAGAANARRMKALRSANKKLKSTTKYSAAQYTASPTTRRIVNSVAVGSGAFVTRKVSRAHKRRVAEREIEQKPWKAVKLKGGGKKLTAGAAVAGLGAGAAYLGGKKLDERRGY